MTSRRSLLVVHHTPDSESMRAMLDQILAGCRASEIVGVDVVVREALVATADDVLRADGYLLGTPANLGYMSGALKHFFDTTYNRCREPTAGRSFGLWIHGESDTDGARLAVEKIAIGLGWKLAQKPLTVLGTPTEDDLANCWELGAATAAQLQPT